MTKENIIAKLTARKIVVRDMERSIVWSIQEGYYLTAQHQLKGLIAYTRGV